MIPLTTTRLRLRAFEDGDLDAVLRLHANPDLARFIPSAITPDEATARRHLARFMELTAHPVQGFSLVELAQTGEAVGLVMVKPIPRSDGGDSDGGESRVLEIGWRQVAEHCGHGYITEAAAAVLDAVHARGVEEVMAVTHPENTASQRVAERIGMQRVGMSGDYYDPEPRVAFRSARRRGADAAWLPERWEFLPVGEYAFPGPLRDRLVGAILTGTKSATTALLAELELTGTDVPAPGRRELVIDSAGNPVCVTQDTAVQVLRLSEVTRRHAVAEGEGVTTTDQWRRAHERFWSSQDYVSWLQDHGGQLPVIDDDTLVVCTSLRVLAAAPWAVSIPHAQELV